MKIGEAGSWRGWARTEGHNTLQIKLLLVLCLLMLRTQTVEGTKGVRGAWGCCREVKGVEVRVRMGK